MSYTYPQIRTVVQFHIDELLDNIVNNSSKCQTCACYHPLHKTCLLAFECLQEDFKAYIKKEKEFFVRVKD